MCGGEGSRLAIDGEKPLLPVAGKPMVERVCTALAASRVDRVYAVTSPVTPETKATVECPCIDTPGDGYVADLDRALATDRVTTPVLTVAADLPLMTARDIDTVLSIAEGGLTVAVPVGRKRALGLSVETSFRHEGCLVTPAGINVVGDTEPVWVTRNPRFGVNVNRRGDAHTAEWLLAGYQSEY